MVNQRCLCFDGVSSVCGHRGFSYHKTGVIYICGKGNSWNWLLGPKLYWCVIQTGSGLMRLYSWSKGLKGNLVWVITTSVFPHSHDCGQCVVSSSVYKPVHLRIMAVQFLLIIGLVTPWLDSLHTCLVVTPAPHLSNMKTRLNETARHPDGLRS